MIPIHLIFDLLAASASLIATYAIYRWRLAHLVTFHDRIRPSYIVALVGGAVLGGYLAGTANLLLSGIPAIGRSIVGALAGAILAVEIWKAWAGVRGSTGLIFVPGFTVSIIIGRIGCYLSGLADNTYGTPTTLPWGHDFGDGIPRHPVQLYESVAMLAFLLVLLLALWKRNPFVLANGFYLMVAVYAGQRFLWEFLKPYPPVIGPLNLFQVICLGLLAYSALMTGRSEHARA